MNSTLGESVGETTTDQDLGWLLDDLAKKVPHARGAVLLSVDGLVLGSTSGMDRDDADHLAAAASGLSSLARGTGRRFRIGDVRQTIVELADAYLLIASAGPRACLAVLAGIETDLGLLAYEAEMMITRVGAHLSAGARLSAGDYLAAEGAVA